MKVSKTAVAMLPVLLLVASDQSRAGLYGNTLVEHVTRAPAHVGMISVTGSLNEELDGIIYRSMGVQVINNGPGYHDATPWKFASPRDTSVVGWYETYAPSPGPHDSLASHRSMTFHGISTVWHSRGHVTVQPGFCADLAPTHIVRLPFGTAAADVVRAPAAGPAMWLDRRGHDWVTSRMASATVSRSGLNLHYRPHDSNGMAMKQIPLTRPGEVAAPELPQRARSGIAEIDVWEDGKVHDVKLWAADGSVYSDERLTDRVRQRFQVNYGKEPKRHRWIQYHRYSLTDTAQLSFDAELFSYQPLCCAEPIRPCGPGTGRFCP